MRSGLASPYRRVLDVSGRTGASTMICYRGAMLIRAQALAAAAFVGASRSPVCGAAAQGGGQVAGPAAAAGVGRAGRGARRPGRGARARSTCGRSIQADVGSKTLGYLDAVLVDRGDRVTRGQLLALVRPSDLPDQLAAARSTLAQVQSSAALARTNYERAKQLAPEAVVSQQELQQAQAPVRDAPRPPSRRREAQIAALAVRLGETRITSPLTGVVVAAPAGSRDAGRARRAAAPSSPSRASTCCACSSPSTSASSPASRVGKDAHVEVDALPGRTFSGKVVRLAPALDPATRTLDAEVQLDNRGGRALPRDVRPRRDRRRGAPRRCPSSRSARCVLSEPAGVRVRRRSRRRRRPPARDHAGRRRRRLVRGRRPACTRATRSWSRARRGWPTG